jgi:Tol biopolymer transport system component
LNASRMLWRSYLNSNTNPYGPDKPVDNCRLLFGREPAQLWVEQQLTLNRRLLVVYGPEGIGKTSLARCLPESLPGYVHPILFECQPYQGASLEEALAALFDVVAQQLQAWELITPDDALVDYPGAAAAAALLRLAQPRLGGGRLLLIVDDVNVLEGMEDGGNMAGPFDVLATLLASVPESHLLLTYDEKAFRRFSHPLKEQAEAFRLGGINSEASYQMITRPAGAAIRYETGAVKRVADLASHHPYYLQLFCHGLFDRCIWSGVLNQSDVDAVLEDLLVRLDKVFRGLWDGLMPVDQAVAMAVAGLKGTHGMATQREILNYLRRYDEGIAPEFVDESLDRLVDGGALVQIGAMSYRFTVNLFRLWIERQFRPAEVLAQVDWERLPVAAATSVGARQAEPSPRRSGWGMGHWVTLFLGLTAAFGLALWLVVLVTDWPTSLFSPSPTPVPVDDVSQSAEPTAVPSPTPIPATPTPTAPVVVARTMPSIAFRARSRVDGGEPADWQVFVSNADGTGRERVTFGNDEDITPVWAPDGSRIAYVSKRGENRDILMLPIRLGSISAEELQPTFLTDHPANDWTPGWAPDGTKLAFTSNRAGYWEIFVVNADGTGLEQVTDTGEGFLSPVWSPDGKLMAFSKRVGEDWDIFVMPAPGTASNPDIVTEMRRLTSAPGNDLSPMFSPRGDQIVFESNRDGNSEIYVMNIDGSGQRNVSNYPSADDHGPVWAPDGRRLLFYSSRDGNWDLFVVSDDGSTVVNLTDTPDIDEQEPSWRP